MITFLIRSPLNECETQTRKWNRRERERVCVYKEDKNSSVYVRQTERESV